MKLSELPNLGAPLQDGIFAGITTKPDGTHHAAVLLPEQANNLTWKNAMNWAVKQGGELPSRPVASLLFANVQPSLKPAWHWTSEVHNASYAWCCNFSYGTIGISRKSYEDCAVAVRLIQIGEGMND